jgi:hypothetical protein
MNRLAAPDAFMDLSERLAAAWLTRTEIERATGLCRTTVKAWVDAMLARKFIVGRPRAGVFKSTRPTEFALSKKWGGTA